MKCPTGYREHHPAGEPFTLNIDLLQESTLVRLKLYNVPKKGRPQFEWIIIVSLIYMAFFWECTLFSVKLMSLLSCGTTTEETLKCHRDPLRRFQVWNISSFQKWGSKPTIANNFFD